jgi:hypothetical protein
MKRIWVVLVMSMVAVSAGPVWAMVHSQKNGLFSMDVPATWHWFEYPGEIIITYPDGQTMAIDIKMTPIDKGLSTADIKQRLKQANAKMLKDGVEAHGGQFIDQKEIGIGGVYATRLDFRTAPPQSVKVAYILFYNKGYTFSISYGSQDDKMISVMDDAVSTITF